MLGVVTDSVLVSVEVAWVLTCCSNAVDSGVIKEVMLDISVISLSVLSSRSLINVVVVPVGCFCSRTRASTLHRDVATGLRSPFSSLPKP